MCGIDKMAAQSKKTLENFLRQHKKKADQPYTHTAIPNLPESFGGSYHVASEDYNEFIDLYFDSVFTNNNKSYLTEKHLEQSPVLIDLDFRFPKELKARQYDETFIKKFLGIYAEHIKRLFPKEKYEMFVLEKKAPRYLKDKELVKDGLHIMIPGLVTKPRVQYVLRYRVLRDKRTRELFAELGSTNTPEDILDLCVIERNNWQMYGSMKPKNEPYLVTRIYNEKLKEVKKSKYSNYETLKLLSLRNKTEDQISEPIEEELEDMDKDFEMMEANHKQSKPKKKKKKSPKAKRNLRVDDDTFSEKEKEKIRKIVNILRPSRADTYEEWIQLGWCLHNIHPCLLDIWDDFSKKSEKYESGACETEWDQMDNEGLGIGTLYMWAKEDNHAKLKKILEHDVEKLMYGSLSLAHNDVAKVIYEMNKGEFKYGTNNWYQFKNHKWNALKDGIELKKKISNQVLNEYLRFNNKLSLKAQTLDDDEIQKDTILQQMKKTTELILKLKNVGFKKALIEECTEFFYDEEFEDLLDSNMYLIGFNNGVYDLNEGKFRDGIPEDHISFSTGIDYIEYDHGDSVIKEIQLFLSQILPQQDIREYVVTLLASMLDGKISQQKFPIWTGSGGNGKSKLIELYTKAFGDYTTVFPISLLTQKRGRSENCTPILATSKGKRFAYFQEPDNDERINIGLMKELTGGDKIKARGLYKDAFEYKPQFKLMLLCNDLPEMPGNDDGTWRRVRVVRFMSKFRDEPNPKDPYEFKIDHNLGEKFEMWAEPFMYLLLQYYKKYSVKEQIYEPPSVKMETQSYKNDSDNFSLFFTEMIQEKPGSSINLEEAYFKFKEWWTMSIGTGKTPSRKEFKTNMEKRFGKGDKKSTVFKGISWAEDTGFADDSDSE